MTLALYHCADARSFRALWALEELGLDYELKLLPFPPRVLAPDYLAENPLGTIPLLVDGGTRMTESAAIVQYLATRDGPSVLSVEPGDQMYRSIAAIQECSARAAALTQKLLAFGRRQVLQPKVVDLSTLVATVEADVRRTYGRRVAVDANITRPLAPVRIDAGHIERALGTIAAHAIDAMPNGGSVTFRAQTTDIGVELPQARAFVKKGRYVRLEIACSGTAARLSNQPSPNCWLRQASSSVTTI